MHVPARTRQQARHRYVHALQAALSCVSSTVWISAPRPLGAAGELALTLSEDPAPLRLRSGRRLYLVAGQFCRLAPDDQHPGAWQMRLEGYVYSVRFSQSEEGECFAWHWHPGSVTDPHLHVAAHHPDAGDLSRLHLPAALITFQAVLRFLLAELGVQPLRADWQRILSPNESRP